MTYQELLDKGFALIPVGTDKRPLMKGSYLKSSKNIETIEHWLKQYRDIDGGLGCQLAVRTGKESGVIVLDFDVKNGGMETLDKLVQEGKVSSVNTFWVETGSGGRHIYYKAPRDQELDTKIGALPGMDILGEKRFAVAPGSRNKNGAYTAIDGPFAELPSWVLDLYTVSSPAPSSVLRTSSVANTGVKGELSKRSLKFLLEGESIPGTWNTELFFTAKDLHEQGYTFDNAIEKLIKVSELPKDRYLGYLTKEDMKTIESAYSKAPRHLPRVHEDYFDTWSEPVRDEIPSTATGTDNENLVISAADLFSKTLDFSKNKNQIKGLQTGLFPFDNILGGLREGEITVVHGEAKAGKSSFLNKIIHSLMVEGVKVGFASREMDPATEVLPALLSVSEQQNIWKSEITQELERRMADTSWLRQLFFAPGYGYFPLDDLTKWVGQLKDQGTQVVFLDHLHYTLMAPEDHKEASLLLRQIKTLAMDTKIHFIIVVQANKLLPEQQLGRNSLKGGAAISQTLNSLFLIERVKPGRFEDSTNVMKVTLDFARSPLAKPGEFYLRYNSDTTDLEVVELELVPDNSYQPGSSYRADALKVLGSKY